MKIGVLGGIGPEATGKFYLSLINKMQKYVNKNEDFPQIIINSIPAPELIYENVEKDKLKSYIEGLKELDGCDFIVMVCNTVHLFYDEFQKCVKTPIIDLREEVKKEIFKKGIKNITVIGTPTTINSGLYEFEGINYHNPDADEQKMLTESIFNFNKGNDKNNQKKKAEMIINKYMSNGSECVILGCTEFGVMLEDMKIPKINTIEVLVDIVVNKIFN